MKPPICEFCDDDFRNREGEGGLVTFKLTGDDEKWHERQKEEDFIGHPPEKAWFCGRHYAAAQKLSHLTRREAIAQLTLMFKPEGE